MPSAVLFFGSSRALATHIRIGHKQRSGLRCFLDASATCPVCKTQFASRIRWLAHVSEQRKRGASQALSCRERLERGEVSPLESSMVDALDEIDKKLRAEARRSGRVQPLVLVKASRTKTRGQPDAVVPCEIARRKRKCPTETIAPDPSELTLVTVTLDTVANPDYPSKFTCEVCGSHSLKRRRLFKKCKPNLMHVCEVCRSCSDILTPLSLSAVPLG